MPEIDLTAVVSFEAFPVDVEEEVMQFVLQTTDGAVTSQIVGQDAAMARVERLFATHPEVKQCVAGHA
jgi:hypothetical protein